MKLINSITLLQPQCQSRLSKYSSSGDTQSRDEGESDSSQKQAHRDLFQAMHHLDAILNDAKLIVRKNIMPSSFRDAWLQRKKWYTLTHHAYVCCGAQW